MLILADALVSTPDRVLRPGHLRISGPTIREIGTDLRPLPGEQLLELPGLTLAPGFLNLHAHLELAPLHQKIPAGLSFPDWLARMLSLRPSLHSTARTAAILDSSRRAAETGTTTLLNIVSDPAALAGLAGTLPRVWWALELIDLHEDPQPAIQLDRLSAWLSRHPGCPWHAALSPHAPYTASPRLYRDAARLAQDLRLPFTTHWAESVEEKELFTSGRGPLRALLPDQWTAGNLADRASALPTGSLLAHANHLSDADLAAFAQRRCFVVHCPTTHRWLGRDPFPLEKFRAARIPVLLGTDSPASSNNSSFDLRVEARSLLQSHPSLPPAEIWSMLTTLPASALGQAERLGSLTPGAQADFVAWRLPPTPPAPRPRPHPHPATPTPPAPRPADPAIPAILASTGPAEIISVAGHLHRPETPQSP